MCLKLALENNKTINKRNKYLSPQTLLVVVYHALNNQIERFEKKKIIITTIPYRVLVNLKQPVFTYIASWLIKHPKSVHD